MKVKYAWVALLTLTFFGCDDNTGALGLGMFPESDQLLNGKTVTYELLTKSKIAEKVFSKTTVGYVGKFSDPNFGYYEAGFLAQLHCPDSLTFPDVYNKDTNPQGIMVKDEVYTTELVLSYTSYFGDSLTPCRMSVYELGGGAKDLNKESAYYTNIDPAEYYNANDPNALLGRKAYTAVDLSLSDSIRNSANFYPYVRFTLPKDKGTKILEASRRVDKGNFADEFKKIFKGIYVKSDYGDGAVLYIDQIELNVVYEVYVKDSLNMKPLKKKYEKDEAGNLKDSTAYSMRTFVATREIIQANSFANDQTKLEEKVAETNWTYLKTPAGIYTQGTLPLERIAKELSGDTLNAIKLTFTSYNQSNDLNKYKFSMSAPSSVLLVREQDLDAFFAENKLTNGISSFIASRNTSTNQYVFNNLVQLVTTCIAEKEAAKKADGNWNEAKEQKWLDEHPLWDKVALIPVLVGYDTSSVKNIISIRNDLRPSYVKLKGGSISEDLPVDKRGEALDFEITYTSFGKK